MNETLFEVPRNVSEQEVRDKIKYFVDKAEKASEIFDIKKQATINHRSRLLFYCSFNRLIAFFS